MDPKHIVRCGYDRVADVYADWSARIVSGERERITDLLLESLPAGAAVLDLGCGNGLPTTARLAGQFQVTGVDVSGEQLARARQHVPDACLIRADIATVDFPAESFDAVTAFFSIIHLPREEHAGLFGSVARWLRPGGYFAASLGVDAANGGLEPDWLGVPMYWSHFDGETSCRLIEQAGLRLERAVHETIDEDGQPVTFLWAVARKP